MVDYSDRIKELEAEMAKMQYNKRTQHHFGLIKAKIAQLREKQEKRSSGTGVSGGGYEVKRTGDATVLLLGYPSAGKSTLLNVLTNQESEVGAYAFTTLNVVPGMMKYKHAKIQVLDVPGIVAGAASGRGRGKEVLASMRSADMALIVVDATWPEELGSILKEAFDAKFRLNKKAPDVRIRRTHKDGIRIGRTVATPDLNNETVVDILKEFRINNADVTIRSVIDADDFIDCVEANRKYLLALIVLNKIDLLTEAQLRAVRAQVNADLCISAKEKIGIEEVKEAIFQKLDLIRVYLKEPTKPADMDVPLIIFRNATIRDLARKLHKDFEKKFKFARVWGPSAKFPGQRLMLQHTLQDTDVVEMHLW